MHFGKFCPLPDPLQLRSSEVLVNSPVVGTVKMVKCAIMVGQEDGCGSVDGFDPLGTGHRGCPRGVYYTEDRSLAAAVEWRMRWRGWGWWKTHLPTQLGKLVLLWETLLFLLAELLSFDNLLPYFIVAFWFWTFLSRCHMSSTCFCVLGAWWVRLCLEKDLLWW